MQQKIEAADKVENVDYFVNGGKLDWKFKKGEK